MSIDLVVNYSIVANPRYYKCEVISYYLAAAKDKAKQLNAARDKVKKIDRGREI